MPDISMCEGKDCPIRQHCYRHTASANKKWQSWLCDAPYDHKKRRCDEYIENDKARKIGEKSKTVMESIPELRQDSRSSSRV